MTWWQWAMIYFSVSIVLLMFWHRMVTAGKRNSVPECLFSKPGPQQRAENDCIRCPWNDLCLRGPARFTAEELQDR